MSVNPVSVNKINNNIIDFQSRRMTEPDLINDLEADKFQDDKKYSKNQVSGIVLATALSAAILAGGAIHGRNTWKINNLKSNAEKLAGENGNLKNSLKTAEEKAKELAEKNETLANINKKLKDEAQKAKDKLTDIFEGDIAPKDVREKIINDLKSKIKNSDYGYDIKNPPVTNKGGAPVYDDAIELPDYARTYNRKDMQELHIPEIGADGKFSYEIPMSNEVKITHMKSSDFKPVKSQPTNISESYADSVQWNNDKISRDILQNFYDGHGQTLDGVKFNFEPVSGGKYKIRIEGQSTYTPDKAIYIGESTKRNDAKAAGNYGEGLKMSVLKLLKDSEAQDVKIGSDNWKVTYSLAKGNLSDKRVLSYSLDKTDKYNGNYIEFETNDKDLLFSLKKTITRFYSSGNEHFKCPDFENDIIGIKNLPKGEKGGIYIAGQRFEFDGDYEGLDNIVIFLKEKPPLKILDPSRDRTSLNKSNLEDIAGWLARDERMSNYDKVKLLKSLEGYWDKSMYISDETPMDKFINRFLLFANFDSDKVKLHIKFPEKYVAYSNASSDVVEDLRAKGYKVCKEDFQKLGMPTIKHLIGDARAHEVVIPNDIQKQKILILKEAINKLSPALEGKHFTADELNTKIYMFDNKSVKDSKMYSDCSAEAIIDKGVSKGFWIDRNYLNKTSFPDVLETALHELSHKAGGDESAEFSYKLTNVNSSAINQIMNDVKTRNEFQALNELWNSISLC